MKDVGGFYRHDAPAHDAATQATPPRRRRRWLYGTVSLILIAAALLTGAWRYATERAEAEAFSAQMQDTVPRVRVATVQQSAETVTASLPATTSAFASANIVARASGYIEKRAGDLGGRVKGGNVPGQ